MPPGNPAVGILREHVLTGFFIDEFGNSRVQVPNDGIARGFDVVLCGHELSVKTTTGNATFKVLWTVDPLQIGREIARDYQPSCDIFLVQIHWGKCKDSIFYIPQEVQSEARQRLGDKYLQAAVGTNHRGISVSAKGKKELLNHDQTISVEVDWIQGEEDHSPTQRWQDYWVDIA